MWSDGQHQYESSVLDKVKVEKKEDEGTMEKEHVKVSAVDENMGQPPSTETITHLEIFKQEKIDDDDEINGDEEMEEDEETLESCSEASCFSMDEFIMEDYLASWQDQEDFKLWQQDTKFREFAKDVVHALEKMSYKCLELCRRAHNRRPTVYEFWNHYLSLKVPRDGWVGLWKVVDAERRGWPLQYMVRSKIQVNKITFASALAKPQIESELVDPPEEFKDIRTKDLSHIQLWQLDVEKLLDPNIEDPTIVEEANKSISLTRRFFDTIFFLADSEDLVTFVENILYDRLMLLYFLENASPSDGVLSSKDRGTIIKAIKHFHGLRNECLELEIMCHFAEDEEEEENAPCRDQEETASSHQRLHVQYLSVQMELEKHKVVLDNLFNPDLRNLRAALHKEPSSGQNQSYECILVVRNITLDEHLEIYDSLASYLGESSDMRMEIVTDLEPALQMAEIGSTIFVVSGNYSIGNLGKLSDGGSLIGIKVGNKDITITPSDDVGDIWMLINSTKERPTILQDLTFVIEEAVTEMSAVVFVSSGSAEISGCTFRKICDVSSTEEATMIAAIRNSKEAVVATNECSYINFDKGESQDIEVVDLE